VTTHSISAGDTANLDNSAVMVIDGAVEMSKTGDAANLVKSAAMDVDGAVDSEAIDNSNTQDRRGHSDEPAENSALQPLTSAKETPAPEWLQRMLVYLRGVSDSTEWQDLVSAFLKFENLNPPSGVGALLNTNYSSNLMKFSH
jgi:hypothetical protein